MEFAPPVMQEAGMLPSYITDAEDMAEWCDSRRMPLYCWECEVPGKNEESRCSHGRLLRPSVWRAIMHPTCINPMLTLLNPPPAEGLPVLEPFELDDKEDGSTYGNEEQIAAWLRSTQGNPLRVEVTPERDLEKGDGDEYHPGRSYGTPHKKGRETASPKKIRRPKAGRVPKAPPPTIVDLPSTPSMSSRRILDEKISPRVLYGGKKAYQFDPKLCTPMESPRKDRAGTLRGSSRPSPYSLEALSASWGLE